LQAYFVQRDAPFLQLGLTDIERTVGRDEAHRNQFALDTIHRRFNQEGRCGGRALDAGLARQRLRLRGKKRNDRER
jgi:hypothetical protein